MLNEELFDACFLTAATYKFRFPKISLHLIDCESMQVTKKLSFDRDTSDAVLHATEEHIYLAECIKPFLVITQYDKDLNVIREVT